MASVTHTSHKELAHGADHVAISINSSSFSSNIEEGIYAICKDEPTIVSTLQKTSKWGLYTLAACCSVGARVFFYPIAIKAGTSLAGENIGGYILGNITAALYSKAFFILEMWAARGIINDSFKPITLAETKVSREQASFAAKAGLSALVIMAALFARYPFALPAAEYNPNHAYLAGGLTLFTSVFIPLRSIQLSIIKLSKLVGNQKQSTIHKMQSATGAILRGSYACIHRSLSLVNQKIAALDSNVGGTELFDTLVDHSTITTTVRQPPKAWTYTGTAVGLFLTGVLEYALASYTFSLTKKYVNPNEILAGFFAFLTVTSTTYLYGKAITSLGERTTNAIYNTLKGQRVKELDEQLFPKSTTALKLIETVSNIFALGPWYIIWGNYFSKPIGLRWFFQVSVLSTLFATLQSSSLDTIKTAILSCNQNREVKKTLNLSNKYERVATMIEKSSSEEYLKWFHTLPKTVRKNICKRAGIQKDQIPFAISQLNNGGHQVIDV